MANVELDSDGKFILKKTTTRAASRFFTKIIKFELILSDKDEKLPLGNILHYLDKFAIIG